MGVLPLIEARRLARVSSTAPWQETLMGVIRVVVSLARDVGRRAIALQASLQACYPHD